MPKIVKELPQGNAYGFSADGGSSSYTATRVFKVILNSPDEPFDISQAVGIAVGDPYSDSNPLPCVSLEGRADGESRMVRIVTVQYRASAEAGGGSQEDPKLIMPDARPANFSTSTSLYEMPASKWKDYGTEKWTACLNPAGDRFDGITKLEPITTIRITQFNMFPGTVYANKVGRINLQTMNLGSFASYEPHTVMFRGVEANPHVETFGIAVVSGFMNTYEFAYRQNWVFGFGACGWDQLVLLEGYNCVAATPNLVSATLDSFALPLKQDDEGKIVVPLELAEGVTAGQKVRAHVLVSSGRYAGQNPAAMPIALNEDGTPRKLSEQNEPIMKRKQTQPDDDLVNSLQLRIA